MRTVTVTTELQIPPKVAWELVQTPAVMRDVSWPLTVFTPVHPSTWQERWRPGDHRFRIRVMGVLPVGEQTVSISFPPHDPVADRYRLRDDGHGRLARTWDHLITLEPVDPDAAGGGAPATGAALTRYTDQVHVDAGRLTVPVWLWAHLLYRWRQRRWRRLARHRSAHASTPHPPDPPVTS